MGQKKKVYMNYFAPLRYMSWSPSTLVVVSNLYHSHSSGTFLLLTIFLPYFSPDPLTHTHAFLGQVSLLFFFLLCLSSPEELLSLNGSKNKFHQFLLINAKRRRGRGGNSKKGKGERKREREGNTHELHD